MKTNRLDDLRNPFAPFLTVEERINSRKNIKCHISNKKIDKGEDCYRFQLFNLPLDMVLYAKKEVFEASDYYTNYRDLYSKNNYPITAFESYDGFKHPDYKNSLKNFSFEKAIALITHPLTQPLRYEYRSGEVVNECSEKERFNIDLSAVTTLLSILIKSGYSDLILDKIQDFPTSCLPLFAMLDDRRFQEKVATILKLEELPDVLEVIRKKKLLLKDFRLIQDFSYKNQHFVMLLSSCLKKYEIHFLRGMTSRGSFMDIKPPKNCRLVYFFIPQPELLPLFKKYLTNKEFPVGAGFFTYMKCYYYRASMFHIAANNPNQIFSWIEHMHEEIQYYYYGSPKAFITDSIKMIQYQLKAFNTQ